jgi:hypothetical protein
MAVADRRDHEESLAGPREAERRPAALAPALAASSAPATEGALSAAIRLRVGSSA